jgi:hypothetical protein
VWSGIFLRGQVDPRVESEIWNEVRNIQTKNKELKTKALELRRYYMLLYFFVDVFIPSTRL